MERRIINYFVLSAPTVEDLILKVREQMEHGYEPLGGVSAVVVKDGKFFQCFQTIVKYA
jgi:Domain of unknown function (DUF1737)